MVFEMAVQRLDKRVSQVHNKRICDGGLIVVLVLDKQMKQND
jgi:hypothetical protein